MAVRAAAQKAPLLAPRHPLPPPVSLNEEGVEFMGRSYVQWYEKPGVEEEIKKVQKRAFLYFLCSRVRKWPDLMLLSSQANPGSGGGEVRRGEPQGSATLGVPPSVYSLSR